MMMSWAMFIAGPILTVLWIGFILRHSVKYVEIVDRLYSSAQCEICRDSWNRAYDHDKPQETWKAYLILHALTEESSRKPKDRYARPDYFVDASERVYLKEVHVILGNILDTGVSAQDNGAVHYSDGADFHFASAPLGPVPLVSCVSGAILLEEIRLLQLPGSHHNSDDDDDEGHLPDHHDLLLWEALPNPLVMLSHLLRGGRFFSYSCWSAVSCSTGCFLSAFSAGCSLLFGEAFFCRSICWTSFRSGSSNDSEEFHASSFFYFMF